MNIEDLLLTKEEIPITHETSFYAPIHPILIDPNTRLNPGIARSLFFQASCEWYEELSKHAETVKDRQTKEWYQGVFLKEKPKIMNDKRFLSTNICGWSSEFYIDDNGFAGGLSVARNSGSLYFNKDDDMACRLALLPDSNYGPKLTPEKMKEFGYVDDKLGGAENGLTTLHIYGKHNVDFYPAALFLRNWAVLYLNEAMRQALEQKK